MNHNQRLLVALSKTEHDTELLQYARLLVDSKMIREIRFVHVQTGSSSKSHFDAPAIELEAEVERRFGVLPDGVIASCHEPVGERTDTLIESATRMRSDIILLGHRKHRSGQRSLARRLAMMAPSSVWMLPEGAPRSIQRILSPVDFSEHSADSTDVAAEIAEAHRSAECLALHVFFNDSTTRYPEQVEALRQSLSQKFDTFMQGLRPTPVTIERRIEEGPDPAQTILRVAKNQESDLIVLDTRGRSRAAAVLLGSVTTRVMVESTVAVLAVKHFGAMMGLFQALKDSQFLKRPNPKSN